MSGARVRVGAAGRALHADLPQSGAGGWAETWAEADGPGAGARGVSRRLPEGQGQQGNVVVTRAQEGTGPPWPGGLDPEGAVTSPSRTRTPCVNARLCTHTQTRWGPGANLTGN